MHTHYRWRLFCFKIQRVSYRQREQSCVILRVGFSPPPYLPLTLRQRPFFLRNGACADTESTHNRSRARGDDFFFHSPIESRTIANKLFFFLFGPFTVVLSSFVSLKTQPACCLSCDLQIGVSVLCRKHGNTGFLLVAVRNTCLA